MTKVLAAASVIWPLLLTTGAVAQNTGSGMWVAGIVYLAGGTVCHQRDDRSFHTHGTKWPVCARCSGLYLAAPLGALAALIVRGRFRRSRDLKMLALAASATALTWGLEHAGLADVSSLTRFIAALPLGAALAWVVVRVSRGPEAAIG